VTALWSFDEQPRTGDPLLPGAAPAAIRDALLPEDRTTFDTAYQRALAAARDTLELTELFRCLEHWRRVALLQRDPDRFASIARRAAERLTGEPVPADEPLAQTRRRAGLSPCTGSQHRVVGVHGAALRAVHGARVARRHRRAHRVDRAAAPVAPGPPATATPCDR
jgi:hypothetical protein